LFLQLVFDSDLFLATAFSFGFYFLLDNAFMKINMYTTTIDKVNMNFSGTITE